jgi:hypothetical protein
MKKIAFILMIFFLTGSVVYAKPLKKKLKNPCVPGTWATRVTGNYLCFDDRKWHQPDGTFNFLYSYNKDHNSTMTRQGIFVSCKSKNPTPKEAIGRIELKSMKYTLDSIYANGRDSIWILCE